MSQGIITDVRYQRGSGICTLVLDGENYVHADAGPTFRALSEAFPEGAIGEEIVYEVDGIGVLEWFSPHSELYA